MSTTYHPASSIFSSMGSCSLYCESVFNSNEKETLQFLNNRLAAYLERVRQLEQENVELERQLQEAFDSQEPTVGPNYLCCFKIIEELQQKVRASGEQTPWEGDGKSGDPDFNLINFFSYLQGKETSLGRGIFS